MKNKRLILLVVLILLFSQIIGFGLHAFNVYAEDGDVSQNYTIYDENNKYLFEKSQVQIGDEYISKNYEKYEVVYLNEANKTGIARFVEVIKKPKVRISPTPSPIKTQNRQIGLYMSHNDESYLPTDGYYTIYGKGGIHDVAKALKTAFENMGINVVLNETLHLPHDGGAYTRSHSTAKKLLNENDLNALFDIHRDGVSRSFYATTVNGKERSKIRIVVGKANPNMKFNEEFALYLNAVADELYPWLISDIYYATGHYNQGLFEKALLFEMGTHLIEKQLVLDSIEPLAHVINVALFNTTVNEQTGELEIGGSPTVNNPTVDEVLTGRANLKDAPQHVYIIYVSMILIATTILAIVCVNFYIHILNPLVQKMKKPKTKSK